MKLGDGLETQDIYEDERLRRVFSSRSGFLHTRWTAWMGLLTGCDGALARAAGRVSRLAASTGAQLQFLPRVLCGAAERLQPEASPGRTGPRGTCSLRRTHR